MGSRSRLFACALVSLVCVLFSGHAVGQDAEFAGLKSNGLFNSRFKQDLNTLFSLKMDRSGKMSLAEEVWDQHGRTLDERIDIEIAKLSKFMPKSMQKQMLDGLKQQIRDAPFCSLTDVFDDLATSAEESSGSRSGGGSKINEGFTLSRNSESVDFQMSFTPTTRGFCFSEKQDAGRTVRLFEDVERDLFVASVHGEDFLCRASQSPSLLNVVLVDANTNFLKSFADWNELESMHPRHYQAMIGTMQRAGFAKPISQSDPGMGKVVLACLEGLCSEKQTVLDELLVQLRSDKKSDRRTAASELAKIASGFRYQLEGLVDVTDTSEFQSELSKIVVSVRHNSELDARYWSMASSRRLCDSPEYLSDLAPSLDNPGKKLVLERLSKLTAQDIGMDWKAWQQWVDENPTAKLNEAKIGETETSPTVSDMPRDSGGMTDFGRRALGDVLCLQLDEAGFISIDKKSWIRNGPTYDELIEAEVKTMIGFGRDRKEALESATRRIGDRMTSGVALAELLKMVMGKNRLGYGKSGADDEFRLSSSSGDTFLMANVAKEDFELELGELAGNRSRLYVKESSDGSRFRFALEKFSSYVLIDQDTDRCLVVFVDGEKNSLARHRSFLEFTSAEPETARLILEQMKQFGADVPPTLASSSVREHVLSQLPGVLTTARKQFDSLIKELGANEFEARSQAKQKLMEQFLLFKSFVTAELDAQTDPEIRKTLVEFETYAKKQTEHDLRSIEFVEQQQLLESPAYLISILSDVSAVQQTLLFTQLKNITKADPGDDVESWTRWLGKR